MKIYLALRALLTAFLIPCCLLALEIPVHYKKIDCVLFPLVGKRKKFGRPRIPAPEIADKNLAPMSSSTNWAGYVASSRNIFPFNSVTGVSGAWTVPTISASTPSADTYCSIWVGLDGAGGGSQTVEQIGTEHDWSNGAQQNYAWFEMYPGYPFALASFPLKAGDSIQASVSYDPLVGVFTLTITNQTQAVFYAIQGVLQSSRRSSAEWIVEAPFSDSVLPLSKFSTVHFTNCTVTLNGSPTARNLDSTLPFVDAVTMVTSAKQSTVKAIPTTPPSGGAFSVSWRHQ